MFDENEDANFPFEINHDKIMNGEDMMNVTVDCCRLIKKQSYVTVGEFLNSIMTSDLQEAIDVIDAGEGDDRLGQFILISEMLARSEGLEASEDFDTLHTRMQTLVNYMVIESLARKGLVKAYRENMSFGDDMAKAIVVERID